MNTNITALNGFFAATTEGTDTKIALSEKILAWALSDTSRFNTMLKMEMANLLFPELPPFFPYLFGETITVKTKEGDVEVNVRDLDLKKHALNLRFVDHRALLPVKKFDGKLMPDFFVWGEKMLNKNLKKAVDFGFATDDAAAKVHEFAATLATDQDRDLLIGWLKFFGVNFKFVVTAEENKITIPVTQEFIDIFGDSVINNWQDLDENTGMYPACKIAIGDHLVLDQGSDGRVLVYVCEAATAIETYKNRDGELVKELANLGL